MYSKYILNSNWLPLSCNYSYDTNLSLQNSHIFCDNNLNGALSPALYDLADISNNNYSLFFLTKKQKLNNLFKLEIPQNNDINSKNCLLANGLDNGLVSDATTFMYLSNSNIYFNTIELLGDYNFFEIVFLDENFCMLYTNKNNVNFYNVIDPINTLTILISGKEYTELPNFVTDKIKLNYIYDKNKKTIFFYKIFNKVQYVLGKQGNELLVFKKNINNLTKDNIFNLISLQELDKDINLTTNWLSYSLELNTNNINVNSNKSTYNIQNNFLFHNEYNNIKDSLNLNYLTLKNQLNNNHFQLRTFNDEAFRDYHTIHGGGDREQGYENLTLSYNSNLLTYNMKSDKTTWFHIPYVEDLESVNINDTNLFLNGSIAGRAPIFSDKIYKKIGDYYYSSNIGNVSGIEHTGQWLCAWLSADGKWYDRFYNPSKTTPFDALLLSPEVSYTPQYKNLYQEGTFDYPSKLNFEKGSWYAYYRVGKNTSSLILSSLYSSNLINDNKYDYSDNFNNNIPYLLVDGKNYSEYKGAEISKLNFNINADNFNNFTLSFIANRSNWEAEDQYQILGNYIDDGFGVINNLKINPVTYYFNNTKLFLLNHNLDKILEIDIKDILEKNYNLEESPENIDSFCNIKKIIQRSLTENFYVITEYFLLEFKCNGILVNIKRLPTAFNFKLLSVNYNNDFIVLLYKNFSIFTYSFKNKNILLGDNLNKYFINDWDKISPVFNFQKTESVGITGSIASGGSGYTPGNTNFVIVNNYYIVTEAATITGTISPVLDSSNPNVETEGVLNNLSLVDGGAGYYNQPTIIPILTNVIPPESVFSLPIITPVVDLETKKITNLIVEFSGSNMTGDISFILSGGFLQSIPAQIELNISRIDGSVQDIIFVNSGQNYSDSFFDYDIISPSQEYSVIIDNLNDVYIVRGENSIFKGSNIYFKDNFLDIIYVYNTISKKLDKYIEFLDKNILSFSFDKEEKTYILDNFNTIHIYDALGRFSNKIQLDTISNNNLSAKNLYFKNTGKESMLVLNCLDNTENNYFYNYSKNLLSKTDTAFNNTLNSSTNKKYDFNNDWFHQGVINSKFPLPSYNFKIKLKNIKNINETEEIVISVISELLGPGDHHFAFSVNTVEGIIRLFLDGRMYSEKKFKPGKYMLSDLFKENLIIGASSYYNNKLYNEFYKDYSILLVNDLVIKDIKIYNIPIDEQVAKTLYMTFFETESLNFYLDLKNNTRNYSETIKRVFKNKFTGSKSNIIDIVIKDSLITDKSLQDVYNIQIKELLKKQIPGHVKINNIKWLSVKESDEKMLEGFYDNKTAVLKL